MDPIASISGLATGIDFRDLVDRIIEVESRRLDNLRLGITRAESTRDAWGEVRGLLDTLRGATRALGGASGLQQFVAGVQGRRPELIDVEIGEGAAPGAYSVRVLERAQSEALGSSRYSSRTAALGLTGRFVVGGSVVDVAASDSLESIAAAVNGSNSGTSPSGVTASVVGVGGSYRMVLSAARTGSEGMGIRDVSGVLTDLGFFDGSTTLANRTSGGFASGRYTDASVSLGELLGFGTGAPSGTVSLGSGAAAFTVALDLSTLSLEGVRDAINAAASAAGSTMVARIEPSTDGSTVRLEIDGSAAAEDDGGVLQSLGVLAGGRSDVQQRLLGGALAVDAGGSPASETSALTSLFRDGSNAGVSEGDTLVFEGVRVDGSAFRITHTVAAGDTVGTLIARLEGAEGFDGGATLSMSADGRLEVLAVDGGPSLISLRSFAGNEAGGRLDLGTFEVIEEGRRRQLAEGRDARVEVDGVLVTSASNEFVGVLPGVSLSVRGADPGELLEVTVTRDVAAGVEAVKTFLDAYNAVSEFAVNGLGVIGSQRPPLAGDSVLLGLRRQLRSALDAALPAGVTGALTRLADIGITWTRAGSYALDESALADALRSDAASVVSLLAGSSSASSPALRIVGSAAGTLPGSYVVDITQAATRASVGTVGFAGTYVDDGVPDSLVVSDSLTGGEYRVALANGMSAADIVEAMRTELRRTTTRELAAERVWYSDAGATQFADEDTPLSALHHAPGVSAGFAAGTTVTFSGVGGDGAPVIGTFEVTDPDAQTVGSLLARARNVFGSGVRMSLEEGQWTVRARSAGASEISFQMGADVAGNAAPLGAMDVVEVGRSASGLTVSTAGGELILQRSAFGSGSAFSVALEPGGGDGTASLGLITGTFDGVDVQGSIGGLAASGSGDRLTAGPDSGAEGLVVRVTADEPGALGTVTFMPGIAGGLERVLEQFLAPRTGAIDGLTSRADEARNRLEGRLDRAEVRLEDRRARLIAQFANLERLIAQAQAQGERLASQLASMPGRSQSR